VLIGNDGAAGVLFIDLDGFKEINDSLGHAAGDGVLVAIADRIRHLAPPGGVTCRVGGDEFLLIVPDADAEALNDLAAQALAAIEMPLHTDAATGVVLSASIGAATWRSEDLDAEGLLARADAAAYRAKSEGKARVHSDDPLAGIA
jgi:diguanylate cyclase (GGDEF)-like protein